MSDITLLIMAAGMGSRYGGLKQLDSVGPNQETIIDYSVYDAIRAGFNKVVFVIREEFHSEFRSLIADKYLGRIKVEFVFQELENLPADISCPEERKNFLSYSYVLHKFCQLLELDDLLVYFPLLKSREKLQQQDRIWEKICGSLRWQYIPSI